MVVLAGFFVTRGQIRRQGAGHGKMRRCTWALPLLVAAICLAGANPASAQAVSGILTGTVVDSSGAGSARRHCERHGKEYGLGTNDGLRRGRPVSHTRRLNPGGYVVTIELTGFKTLTVADINLSTAETRDLGKLKLEVGGVSENLAGHLRSDARPGLGQRPSQDRHRRGLQNIQMKGRDIFGLLAVLPGRPGHEPESRLLVVDLGDADHDQRRAVAEQGRPGRRHQHRRRRRLRHGLHQPQHGCGRRGAGRRQRLHRRERPQQRRPDQRRHQVGHEHVQGLGAWYNGRRDKFNSNDYFRKMQQPGEAALRR